MLASWWFPSLSFLRSIDGGITFSKLPDVDQFVREKSAKIRGAFTGNPAKKHRDPAQKPAAADEEKGDEEEPEEEEEEAPEDGGEEVKEKKVDPSKRRLTELERVAAAAQAVDQATSVVPRGAFYMTATGDIHKNEAFTGGVLLVMLVVFNSIASLRRPVAGRRSEAELLPAVPGACGRAHAGCYSQGGRQQQPRLSGLAC